MIKNVLTFYMKNVYKISYDDSCGYCHTAKDLGEQKGFHSLSVFTFSPNGILKSLKKEVLNVCGLTSYSYRSSLNTKP